MELSPIPGPLVRYESCVSLIGQAAAASVRLDTSTLPGGKPATAESIMQASYLFLLLHLLLVLLVPLLLLLRLYQPGGLLYLELTVAAVAIAESIMQTSYLLLPLLFLLHLL